MTETERLFDTDPYLSSFTATVISCEPSGKLWRAVFDRTAFFPEEGGQSCDTGYANGAAISAVTEEDGVIFHTADKMLEVGSTVECRIDFTERYRKMQNHSGEHVLCGIAHRLWGAENVGFHLSEEYVRMDLDVYLDREKVALLEDEANKAVAACRDITAWYPDNEELEATEFRSKDGISGRVRLVKIDGVDICACCAPHVRSTAEIGCIKVVDSMKYKGGTRLEIVCGLDAARLFAAEHRILSDVASSFSVAREELPSAVERMRKELSDVTYRLRGAEKNLMELQLEKLDAFDGNLCFFYESADPENVREFLNGAAGKCIIAAGFIGNDRAGYSYVIRSDKADLKVMAREINEALSGRGGGSPAMIRGNCSAGRETIEKYFSE